MRSMILAATIALLSLVTTALAAEQMHGMKTDHSSQKMDARRGGSPADKAFEKAMNDMHKSMMIDYSGNPDVDFVRGMIPHHQGAIDMARIELKYGKDPELRKLAQDIIAAQESEIAGMKAWLKKHGK
ncbi:MAG: DUF305 domain-containing protein [Rhizobiales bacterium 65-79]|nr:DUF305 domain-containing protein [Hyphomicrobiales bacterium]OJU06828.1 MAG: DUF305 domain-containing protein [Rhizobiales bacterium 65-79]